MKTTTIMKGYINTPAGQLHYRTAGSDNAVPLVLLHQTPSSSSMFEALMPCLIDNYWLIAPDLPGFGASFTPEAPLSMRGWSQAIHFGLMALGAHEYYLFGHHTGAAVALHLTANYPQQVRALAMCGPPLLTDIIKQSLRNRLPNLTPTESGDFLIKAWRFLRHKSADVPFAVSSRELQLSLALGQQYKAAYEAVFAYDFAADLAKIKCPTLLIAGEQDSLYSCLVPTAQQMPQAMVRVVPNADTYICEQQPQRLATHLKEIFA